MTDMTQPGAGDGGAVAKVGRRACWQITFLARNPREDCAEAANLLEAIAAQLAEARAALATEAEKAGGV